MHPLLVIYMSMVTGFNNVFYKIDRVTFLLAMIVGLQILSIALTHTNLKTWLAKAKWGVKYGLSKVDNAIMRFVDNR